MRLLSAEASIPLGHIRGGRMSDDDWSRVASKMGQVSEAPLYIDDSPNLTMMEIRAKARRLKQKHDLKLVVIDYIQLMTSGKKVESRQLEVSEFSRQIKLLAKGAGSLIGDRLRCLARAGEVTRWRLPALHTVSRRRAITFKKVYQGSLSGGPLATSSKGDPMPPQDPPLPTQPVSVPRPGGAISPLTADEAQVADLAASFHTDSAPQRSLAIIILVIGGWQTLLATAAIMSTLLWWPAVDAAAAGAVGLGPLTLTAATGILLLGVVGGVAGSLVHTITIFSSRVGRSTLEASYLWWYLLRPFGAALLALIFVATMMSGMVALGGDTGVASGTMAFVGGGLAGLFTDAVLQKLRGILGATSTEKMASQQALPLAPPPA